MPRKKRNLRLFKWLTKYHGYMGVAFGILIISASLTGIFLNHEDFILGLGKTEPMESTKEAPSTEPHSLLWADALPAAAISFEQALALAARAFGEQTPLDRIELKDEGGQLVYKIRTKQRFGKEREIVIDAFTGDAVLREEGGYLLKKVGSPDEGDFAGVDWGKLIEAIHTGEFFGGWWGKLLIDLCAVVMIFLTGSGMYMWWTTRSRSRREHRAVESS